MPRQPRSPQTVNHASGPLVGTVLLVLSAAPTGAQDLDPLPTTTPRGDELELPAILVTGRIQAEGVPDVPLEAVGSRDVLGPEAVRATGARDVNDLLQHLPALSTRPYNGGEAAAPSFSARGLPDDGLTEYLHVLIDGVPASPLPYGWTAFSFFPLAPERIHAIDYQRGAHAVRYSPNSVGGVLNFVTRPLPSDPTLDLFTSLGTHGYASHLLTGGGRTGDWSWRLEHVDREGDGYRQDGAWAQEDLHLKARRDLGDGDWLAISGGYMESAHKAPGGLTQAEFQADPFSNARPHNRFEGYRASIDLLHHANLGRDTWVETFAYHAVTKRHLLAQRPHFPGPADPLTLSDWVDHGKVAAVGLRFGHELGGDMEHELYGGLRYQREWIPSWTIDSGPLPGGPFVETQDIEYGIDAFSAHLDDRFSPADGWTMQVGGRFELVPSATGTNTTGTGTFDFDEDFAAFLPGLGLSYAPTAGWSLFGNWFEGFRAPQAWGFGLVPDPSDSDLDFERSRAFELGARWRPSERAEASATLWRNEYDDFGVFHSGFYENLGSIEAQGLDLEGAWSGGDGALERLSLTGSVTLQESELTSGPNEGNELPYAWETKAAWRASYLLGDRWDLSLGGTYVGDSFADEANTVLENPDGNLGRNPSRTLWDAQVGGEWEVGPGASLRLGLGATNLFDEEWYVHSRGGFFGGGKVVGPPLQGFASISFTLNV